MAKELIISPAANDMARKKNSDAEVALLKQLEKSVLVDVVLPPDMPKEDFNVALSAVCKTFVKSHVKEEAMFLVLGELLLIAGAHPELYQPKYETLDAFIESLEQSFGVGRSTCYDAKKAALRWGKVIEIDRFPKIGRVKLAIVSKAVPVGDEGKATARKLLEICETKPAKDVLDYCYEKGYLAPGEASGSKFSFTLNKKQHKIFTKWFGDPRVHAVCESSQTADILEHMIQECEIEWIEKGEAAMKEREDSVSAAS